MALRIEITDISILGGIILMTYLGYRNGFFDGLLGLFGFYFSLTVSFLLLQFIAPFFSYVLELPPNMSVLLGFSFLFSLIMLGYVFFVRWVHTLIKMEVVDWYNRLSGAVLGLYKGTLIVSLVLVGFSLLPLPRLISSTENSSLFFRSFRCWLPLNYNYVRRIIPGPPSFENALMQSYERVGETDRISERLLEAIQECTTRPTPRKGPPKT